MTITTWALDAVSGSPTYAGRDIRQPMSALLFGATAARPLGGRSGVRPGTSTATITATSATWTVRPHSGMLDLEAAIEASCYLYAVNANVAGSMTAAHATFARIDIICAQLDDPSESDGSTVPQVTMVYTAGTASGSPVAPATPARSMLLATISVPASGGGAPTVSWVAPYLATSGGFVTVRDTTERSELYTAYGASTHAPLVVWRIDATGGRNLEATITNDSGWFVVNDPTYAWAAYTPTVTPDTGAFTTVTPALRYNVIGGKSVLVKGTITFTTVGTAAGNVTITLPPGLAPFGVGSIGAARLSNGTAGTVIVPGSTAVIRKYDGSSPISTSGSSVTIEFTYEIA